MRGGMVSWAKGWQTRIVTHPLVVILAAAVAAIQLDYWAVLPPKTIGLIILTFAILTLPWRPNLVPVRRIVWIALLVAALALGHHHQHWYVFAPNDIGWQGTFLGRPVKLICELAHEPQLKSPSAVTSPLQFKSTDPTTKLRLRVLAAQD